MTKGLTATTVIEINAPVNAVWKGLTTPEIIREYFFGTEAVSEWKVGSPIYFRGEWEGKAYEDKGTILEIQPDRLLRYNYWSNLSGSEDLPENYSNITYELEKKVKSTVLRIAQDGIKDEATQKHSQNNWESVMGGLKRLLEQ